MNTLFITGAGAHIPYGFPSGRDLIKDIIYGVKCQKYAKEELGLKKKLEDILTEDLPRIDKGPLNEFIDKLSESGQSSIDKFLSLDTVTERLGKELLIIILSIYECNNNPHGKNLDSAKFKKLRNESIYHVITNTLDIVKEDKINRSIKYITFNYDRCLESFLCTTFRNSYNISFPQSTKYIDNQIIHVHGSIGKFTSPQPKTRGRIEYGSERVLDYEDDYLIQIMHNIDNFQIAFNSNHSQKKDKITKSIKEADEIIFLGFAYAEENMKALSLDGNHNYAEKDVYCCTYGLTKRKVEQLEKKLHNIFNDSKFNIEKSRKKDGATFLRDHWIM